MNTLNTADMKLGLWISREKCSGFFSGP